MNTQRDTIDETFPEPYPCPKCKVGELSIRANGKAGEAVCFRATCLDCGWFMQRTAYNRGDVMNIFKSITGHTGKDDCPACDKPRFH